MAGARLREKPKTGPKHGWLIPALSAVALVLILLLLLLFRGGNTGTEGTIEPEQEQETPETVVVGGQQVVIDQNLAQSELEREHFQTQEDGAVTYSGTALYGVDVSSHQGMIDWAAVAGDGNQFAILRIGNRGYSAGAIRQDERFEENYAGATDNGLEVGVYFFSQAVNEQEAQEEAQCVIDWLDGRTLEGPVVYDWEPITEDVARTDGVEGQTVTACARAFCDAIREAGYTPMLYCNGMLGYLSYDLAQLQDVGIWYAEYSDYPSYAYAVELWQYTNAGTVTGIEGNADRDIWFR